MEESKDQFLFHVNVIFVKLIYYTILILLLIYTMIYWRSRLSLMVKGTDSNYRGSILHSTISYLYNLVKDS
jgi:hypothetical protein